MERDSKGQGGKQPSQRLTADMSWLLLKVLCEDLLEVPSFNDLVCLILMAIVNFVWAIMYFVSLVYFENIF
jgi:hypothetical protein